MNNQEKIGIVISNKTNKTINVLVRILKNNLKYKKKTFISKYYMTHDINNIANIGDIVLIKQCNPISKKKNWKLIKILKKYL